MAELLSTRQAADRLGVGPTSVKRWADEGLLPCVKTAGGHRRFRAEDVTAFQHQHQGAAPTAPQRSPQWLDLLLSDVPVISLQAYALQQRAELGSWTALGMALGSMLEQLGTMWEDGRITVLQEHLASERLSRTLAWASEQIPVSPTAACLLLLAAEGDEHTLGLSLVELVAREAGYQARWAGSKTPIREIRQIVESGEIDIVAVSASLSSSAPEELERQAGLLAGICSPHEVELWLGGAGAWPEPPPYGRRLTRLDQIRA